MAVLAGGISWMMATYIGLSAGEAIFRAMIQAAIGTIGALGYWAICRLLTGRDVGLVIFMTVLAAAFIQSPPKIGLPDCLLQIWGIQGFLGLCLVVSLLIAVRLAPESLKVNGHAVNAGKFRQHDSSLWDSDLDQMPGCPT
jgi:hypothetical protein